MTNQNSDIQQSTENYGISGLNDEEVKIAREKHGSNVLQFQRNNSFLKAAVRMLKEPMVILLLTASSIYFISGKTGDGLFLLGAIVFQALISLYQDSRSKNALEKLKIFSETECKVIRNGKVIKIPDEELVIGDHLLIEEGNLINADGSIIYSNDFSVNESILTGESLAVSKSKYDSDNLLYSGTTVSSGMAIGVITAIGKTTRLGKIGDSIANIKEEKTPLEIKISSFVVLMAKAGALVFVVVWLLNYFHTKNIIQSLLQSLTLAMSILPEEIPVAFTTFMALGAWRLMKKGIVVKQMKTVETLGSATVICTDKTGTITENRMSLAKVYVLSTQKISEIGIQSSDEEKHLLSTAMWASEPIPFDPMELALHSAYSQFVEIDQRPSFKIIREYPLEGNPPMMTHVFEDHLGKRQIAAKGAAEALIQICPLTSVEISNINASIQTLAKEGYRVLAVAESKYDLKDFPAEQRELPFQFIGLVSFYDPPKSNMKEVLQHFYSAGISVKIITGDNAETTKAIANQIGFLGSEKSISGTELMQMSEQEFENSVMTINVFTRMFPDAKLRIINALKRNNQIVAMTGDGVNDGPALRAAHIGIAMGKKGSEIAKQASSLILLEDDLSKMVDAVAMGRKIYSNLKKAIQYIISIHIPIILIVFIPLALGWIYPNIFSPLHIIFLELIMGPTCSVIYENEPMEANTMFQKPKPYNNTFFNWVELSTSMLQGLMITAGALSVYWFAVSNHYSESYTRSMTFTVLIVANIFLTLVNRSFYYSIIHTIQYKNRMILWIITISIGVSGLMLYLDPLSTFFQFEAIAIQHLFVCIGIGFVSVIWYEPVKYLKRKSQINRLSNQL